MDNVSQNQVSQDAAEEILPTLSALENMNLSFEPRADDMIR